MNWSLMNISQTPVYDSSFISAKDCFEWCQSQTIAHVYENEMLLVGALFFFFIHYIRPTIIKYLPEEYRRVANRLADGFLLGGVILVVVYTYLLSRGLP